MNVVLVQLQQENNEHKKSINHKERKNRRVSQFFKIPGYTCLKFRVNDKTITVKYYKCFKLETKYYLPVKNVY